MDTLCSAGKNAQEKEQGPQGYCSGGVDVGNGACHGYFHLWKPEVDCLLRPGKDVEGQDEPSGPLAGGLNISTTVEELCLGPGMAGDLLQGRVDVELSLDKRLDLELEGMSRCPDSSTDHPHSHPSCPCETTGGDRRGAYQSVVEPTAHCLDTSSCQEDGVGSDLEGLEEVEERGTRDGEKAEGQDELEEEEEEYQDRSGDNEGRDSRSKKASGFWRSRGGKRGRGGGEQNQQPASLPSSGGRHKQARRRNHHHHQHGKPMGPALTRVVDGCRRLVSEFLCQWCMSYLRMVAELIVLVAHRCGEAVEFAGAALYDSGSQLLSKATDLPAIKAEAGCLLQRMRRAAEALVAWTTKMAASSHRACVSCFSVLHVAVLLGSWWLSGLLGRLGGERGRRWWAGVCRSRAGTWVAGILDKVRAAIWKCRSRASSFSPKLASEKGKSYPGQELERLLALAQIPEDELDPFAVLGVEASATDPELKRAYRQLAVLVHPDKNKHPRAGEAFKVLRAAWDIVSNPETRREYQLKRMAETELSKSMNEFLTKLQDDLKEAMNTMMCTRCEGKHKRFEMERDPSQARFCADCNKCHSAEEGDFWAESSMLGLRITYFAFIDGKVYDITEWAGCQRIGISPDTHRVPYHISFGSKSNTSATRQRAPSEPPPSPGSPADLQDFFNRIFQGAPPDSMAANGGFFPATPPPPSHQHPGPSGVAPSPQQPGTFAPGGPRAEGGKAPRRKKKVRRPFQR